MWEVTTTVIAESEGQRGKTTATSTTTAHKLTAFVKSLAKTFDGSCACEHWTLHKAVDEYPYRLCLANKILIYNLLEISKNITNTRYERCQPLWIQIYCIPMAEEVPKCQILF